MSFSGFPRQIYVAGPGAPARPVHFFRAAMDVAPPKW
jgi:hypothetical protein